MTKCNEELCSRHLYGILWPYYMSYNIHLGFFLCFKSPIASITMVIQHSSFPVLKFLKVLKYTLKLWTQLRNWKANIKWFYKNFTSLGPISYHIFKCLSHLESSGLSVLIMAPEDLSQQSESNSICRQGLQTQSSWNWKLYIVQFLWLV